LKTNVLYSFRDFYTNENSLGKNENLMVLEENLQIRVEVFQSNYYKKTQVTLILKRLIV